MQSTIPTLAVVRRALIAVAVVVAAITAGTAPVRSAAVIPPKAISQLPLTIAIPAHPQVLLALGNSESMDGNLGGAIMAGSGSLAANLSLLSASSSPASFTIPGGFTPPLDPGPGDGTAPYTVNVGGTLYDNSPSRLNVAKAGIAAVLASFMSSADFALLDYQTGGATLYTTWLYDMSPPGGFVFTNTQVAGNRYAPNPCFGFLAAAQVGTAVAASCAALDASGQITATAPDTLATAQWMQVDATQLNGQFNGGSSDDPLINDVLYAGAGIAPVCLVYGGPHPASPYTGYNLGDYNNNPGSITESYAHEVGACAPTTTPTNAGFVPYTPQTIYMQRGFGYGASQSATAATTLVGMTTTGQTPTNASVAAAVAKFTPYLAPETNNPGSSEIKASGGQSALPGLLQGAAAYFRNSNPASSNGCAAQRYVVLLTDGLPTLDGSGHSWPPPGTTSASEWGMTVGFNPDGSLNGAATNDQAVIDTVTQLQALQATGINTYVIGLGAGVNPAINPAAAQVLTAFAIAGGTGSYFAATSPTALTSDLQTILAKILAATQSTAATAVNSTGLHNGPVAYLAQFTTADNFQDWTGNLFAFPIDPATGAVNTAPNAAIWSARNQLDAVSWDSGRLIATWDPVALKGTPFRWNAALAPAGISATTATGMQLASFAADTSGQDVLQFLRGSNAQELRNGGQFRNRTHKLGDIVSSAPLYVGAPSGFSQSASYFAFARANGSRSPLIYVGADDGMLHAFDAATGSERFAYVPNGVFSNLIKLVYPYYNSRHQFYVNGSPQAADVQFSDGSWHTVLAGTEGAGGKSVFALDVSKPDSLTSEALVSQAVLWEVSDAVDMGLSFSTPAFASTSNAGSSWLVFVGNGYNSPNQKPVLYALNPQTGATVAKVDLCAAVPTACTNAVANGLSGVSVVNSSGQFAAFADTVYAGDLQGNVWRVDISNPDPALWAVAVIFQARDAAGNVQSITTTPAVALNPDYPRLLGTMVYVGTGQLLGLPDLATTGVQSLYGIFDPPTGAAPPLGFAGTPTRSNLEQQTLASATVAGVAARVIATVQAVTLPSPDRGWYMDLSLAAGERIVTNPVIEPGGALVVTSYQPNANSCTGGGNAWLMVLNAATGGAFPLPELDLNGDGVLNRSDQTATGQNPVGVFLGSVYASSATLLSSSGGPPPKQSPCPGPGPCPPTVAAGGYKLVSLSNGTVRSVADRAGGKQRISWWEVRH
ncbi:MAG: PilC/PilY family type IV pilus protein [Steroidobacteraceae bacterium]